MTRDRAGKVIPLSGATDGIGKAAAAEFAKRGATLPVVGRNREKTAHDLKELQRASGNGAARSHPPDAGRPRGFDLEFDAGPREARSRESADVAGGLGTGRLRGLQAREHPTAGR